MNGKHKIGSVVVMYDPPEDVLGRIRTYSGDVDVIYAIDNSEPALEATASRISSLDKAVYIPNGSNLGIAQALNIGAERALQEGCDYLLTMDQDSRACPGMVKELVVCAEADPDRIAIAAPVHRFLPSNESGYGEKCHEVQRALTSGNLLNLRVYRAAGPFRDDFFIDHVDDEYCLRLRQSGFAIVLAHNAMMEHSLGATRQHRLLFKKFFVTHHSAIRKYYGIRNRFYLKQQYARHFSGFFRFFYLHLFREVLTVLLFEREKRKKIRMMLQGFLDYRKGIMGRFQERDTDRS